MRARSLRQQTLKTSIRCTGTGLHSGLKVTMVLHPADPGHGIVFCRTDLAGGGARIPARFDRVVDSHLCTAIADDSDVRVGTVEHLMAALYGAEIDNALIDISGPEVPVMDGSAEPFLFLIDCAGVVEQDAPRRAIEITRRIAIDDGERSLSLTPGAGFSIDFAIDFDNAMIQRQVCIMALDGSAFRGEIARARTFGFEEEVSRLRAAGLARGGSLENAVVIGADRILNEDGLRFDDEFVRHKVLDCVGDLYLAGAPIIGHVRAVRSGHALNNRILRQLFQRPGAWRWVEMTEALARASEAQRAAGDD